MRPKRFNDRPLRNTLAFIPPTEVDDENPAASRCQFACERIAVTALGDYFEDAKKSYLTLLLNFLGIQDIRFFGIMATTQDEAAVAGNLSKAKHEIISAVSSS